MKLLITFSFVAVLSFIGYTLVVSGIDSLERAKIVRTENINKSLEVQAKFKFFDTSAYIEGIIAEIKTV